MPPNTSSEDGSETLAQLLYEETVRRVSTQRDVLESIRSRALALLGAAAIATSLVAGLAEKGGRVELGLFGLLALAAFALATLVCAWLLMPPRLMTYSLQQVDVDGLVVPPPPESAAAAYDAARKPLEGMYFENYNQLKSRSTWMYVLPVIVGAELILWVLEFWVDV